MQREFIREARYTLWALLLVLSFLSACANKASKPEVVIEQNIGTTKPTLTSLHQIEYEKGLDLMKAKSFDQAHIIFTKITTSYPNLAGAYVNLALIYNAKSNENQAELHIKKALQINPNNVDALIQIAALRQKSGGFKEVENYLLIAEAIDSSNEIVQYNLAVLYEIYLQQYDDAINHYENYLALTSNDDKETVKRWIKLLERK